MQAVTRLAAVTKATVDEGVHGIYADTLEEIDLETLLRVFDRAERTCRFLPTPAELREMAGLWDGAEIDKAWTWVQDYLAKHGPEGREHITSKTTDCGGACGGTGWVDVVKDGKNWGVTGCSCRAVVKLAAPEIPGRIRYTLRAMANSVTGALEMIQETPASFQGKVRRDFNEAYQRAQIMMQDEVNHG